MKSILVIASLVFASATFAADKVAEKGSAATSDKLAKHIEMHELMAKAHQKAADCLRSGKDVEECRKAFHSECKQSGSPEMCGKGMMMHHKGHGEGRGDEHGEG